MKVFLLLLIGCGGHVFAQVEKPNVVGMCGSTVTGLLEGTIASPGFPNENYPDDSNCTYEIVVPDGYVVSYQSTFLKIEDRLNGFCFDFVRIFPSGDLTQSNARKFCGNDDIPFDTTSGTKLIVTFNSDDSINDEGFVISWAALNISGSEPTFNCDFDGAFPLCPGWTQSKVDDFDWSFGRGPTPSEDTGPSADHTTDSFDGRYAFIEASGRAPDGSSKDSKVAELLSPPVELTEHPAYCLELWYHNLGTGKLRVVQLFKDKHNYLATVDGDILDQWQQVRVTLPGTNRTSQIGIEATRGRTFRSDVAVDDITLVPQACNDDEDSITNEPQSTEATTSLGRTRAAFTVTATTSTFPQTKETCDDVLSSCASLRAACEDSKPIRRLCRRTCNACLSPLPEDEPCTDVVMMCPSLAPLCDSTPAVRDICQQTCDVCNVTDDVMNVVTTMMSITDPIPSSSANAGGGGCVDLNEERCRRFTSSCYMDIFKVVCPKTCGTCEETEGEITTKKEYEEVDRTDCQDTNMDIMFLVDGSGSIKMMEFAQVIQFVKQVCAPFDLSKDRVGVMQYSHWFSKRPLSAQPYLETVIPIGQYTDIGQLSSALDTVQRHGHTSYTAHAIEKAARFDFPSSPRNDDVCTYKVLIVVTDGSSSDSSMLMSSSNFARESGITLFAVGVRGYSLHELQTIASGATGSNDRVYATNSFSDLVTLIPHLRAGIHALK
ncbi:unnamed protein product [Clavelina lepadiformis]|uniref:Uncharacterized protein n=1 Tax=Clavelina lepadiformis TaxID=159417 RepID=A0ABP0G0J7_CLALP